MAREWVDDMKPRPRSGPDTRDKRWVMRCDVTKQSGRRCTTQGEPSRTQPPLADYAAAGWFIAELHGDVCPKCLANGYQPWTTPHPSMTTDKES